jgi:hypothetical protein
MESPLKLRARLGLRSGAAYQRGARRRGLAATIGQARFPVLARCLIGSVVFEGLPPCQKTESFGTGATIRLTSHAAPAPATLSHQVGAADRRRRKTAGPWWARTTKAQPPATVIGPPTHSGLVQRPNGALDGGGAARLSRELDKAGPHQHRPTDIIGPTRSGPTRQDRQPRPLGRAVADVFAAELAAGYDIRPPSPSPRRT